MKGDFTRWTFDASKQYSSVRLQQGRVLLDADWNEQVDISSYRETTANKEIIGLYGVPDLTSFALGISDGPPQEITLGQGICYVDGILCENEREQTYSEENGADDGNYLVYLEVWQHHITAIEVPELLEPALGGPDTTTRTQTYWKVKFSKFEDGETPGKWQIKWETILGDKKPRGQLEVRTNGTTMLPNDLYRVEIHQGGAYDNDNTTFKWAKSNASMAARMVSIADLQVTIVSNPQVQFQVGDWIEITDQSRVLAGEPGFFALIDNVQNNVLILNPDEGDVTGEIQVDMEKTPTVRIWGDDAKTVVAADGQYIQLENGLEVKFSDEIGLKYETGDYWLIPTRSQEEINWPYKEPDGIDYHYCPLAIVKYESENWAFVKDCRYVFPAIAEVARETAVKAVDTIKGTELSIGVHSYNDSRRTYKETENYTEDNLDIQGGKHLKLNVGFWKDELDGVLWPPDGDRVEGMSFCVADRPRMKLDKYGRLGIGTGTLGSGTHEPEAWLDLQPKWELEDVPPANGDGEYIGLHINPTFPAGVDESKKYALKVENGHVDIGDSVTLSGDLTVAGKSHLQNIVSIGTEPPQADGEETIGLNVKPALKVPGDASEVVGLKLQPTLEASHDTDRLTGLHINPEFQTDCCNVQKQYGLIVETGKVGIGSTLNEDDRIGIGVDVRSGLIARNNDDKLVGLYIQPDFDDNGKDPVEHYGLIVEEGKVGIGSELNAEPALSIGVDVRSGLIARNNGDKLVGLYIQPDFDNNGKDPVEHYGLIVEEGKVGIGSELNAEPALSIGVDVRSGLIARNNGDKLVGLYIQPDFDNNGKDPVEHYGLIVEEGKVAIGPPDGTDYPVEIDGADSKVENLQVTGDLEVIGDVTYRGNVTALAVEKAAGEIRLGDDDRDRLIIHATMSSEHTSGKMKLTSPLEIQLKDTDTDRDFLSLFSTGVKSPTQGRIVWKKGVVTELLPAKGSKKKPAKAVYNKQSKVVAAIYSSLNSEDGDLKFGTASSSDPAPVDRMVITAEGNVCIGTTAPAGNKLKVTDNTELQDLKVLGGVTVDGSTTMSALTLLGEGSASDPTLRVTQGNVCIGASEMPSNYKLYVTGGETHLEGALTVATGDVAIASGNVTLTSGSLAIGSDAPEGHKLKVTGGTTHLDGALTVEPSLLGDSLAATQIVPTLTADGENQVLSAVKIDPSFIIPLAYTGVRGWGLRVEKGDVAIASGSLEISTGNVTIGGEADSSKKLKVTGETHLDGALTVATGDVAIAQGSLAIGGDSELNYKLVVAGNTKIKGNDLVLQVEDNTQEQGVLFQNAANAYTWRIYRQDAGDSDAALKIAGGFNQNDYKDLSDRVTIKPGGAVGIGTTDPRAKLEVSGGAIVPAVGDTEDSGILFPKNPGGGSDDAAWIRYYVRENDEDTTFEIGTSNDVGDHIVLQTSGGVGIGKVPNTTENVKLDVVGKVRADDIVLTSDATLKENIQTLKDGLTKIVGLRGVSYQWKDDKKAAREATEIGLVAQEVEALFPELVSTDSQGMKSLSYSKLIAPLIEAIKEQQGQISELANQVQQQQTQIEQLQTLKN